MWTSTSTTDGINLGMVFETLPNIGDVIMTNNDYVFHIENVVMTKDGKFHISNSNYEMTLSKK